MFCGQGLNKRQRNVVMVNKGGGGMNYLKKVLEEDEFVVNEPLRKHCTMGIGGPARVFASPSTPEKFCEVISSIKRKKDKYIVLGKGSNVLFDDLGFNGIVVSTAKISGVSYSDCGKIIVGAGKTVSSLVTELVVKGYVGLEFMIGIPGSIGGAVYMNAGAFGHEISEFVSSVIVFDGEKCVEISKEQLDFSYRHSLFVENKKLVVLKVVLSLNKGEPQKLLIQLHDYLKIRESSQPRGRSAGCVFKRVGNISAGKLIDDCGLKGVKIGGAVISSVHANFFINENNASSQDILDLIELAKIQVKEKFFKELELEIEYIK